MRTQGFTLVELLIVIAIIGILFTISIPTFRANQAQEQAQEVVVEIEKLFSDFRLNVLLQKNCPLAGNWTLFFIDDTMSMGCGFPTDDTYATYNVVKSVDTSVYTRADITMLAYYSISDGGIGRNYGVAEIGEDSAILGSVTTVIQELSLQNSERFAGGVAATPMKDIFNSHPIEGIEINIATNDARYEKTICYNARTLLVTTNNGNECAENISSEGI